jgi:hypothetical protein
MIKTGFLAAAVFGWVMLSSVSFGATYGGGTGIAAAPYQIWTPQQMNMIGANLGDWGKYFILMADIDMSIYTGTQYKIIGTSAASFTGSFDGNNHIISNLTYTTAAVVDNVGLFGYITNAAIRDLDVENVNISTGGGNVGGLVGYQYSGTITACSVSGSVTSYTSASSFAGGLVGYQNSGSITSCSSAGSVHSASTTTSASAGGMVGRQSTGGTITSCFSTASVTASVTSSGFNSYAGGLVGHQAIGTISGCYSTGSVTSLSVSNSYAGGLMGFQFNNSTAKLEKSYSTGQVSATGSPANKGGLLGYKLGNNGKVTDCFWDTQTSGLATSAGGSGAVGKTTVLMKTLSTFTAAVWDFTNVWDICDGTSYPRLIWQIPYGDMACPYGVGTEDLDYFVGQWLLNNCTSGNNYCGGADMDISGKVDLSDLAIFAQHWLEGINYVQSSTMGGCVMDLSNSPAQTNGLFSESLRFNVTVQGQYILFEDMVLTNCCKDQIQLKATAGSGQILLQEQVSISMWCTCICDFPVTAVLGPFPAGQYVFTVIQSENDQYEDVIGQTPVIIE